MNGKTALALATTAVVFLNVGAAIGCLITKEKLGKEFDERLSRELAKSKKFYNRLHKREENDMPTIVETSDMLPVEREAAQAMRRYQGENTVIDTPREEPEGYETATSYLGSSVTGDVDAPAVNNLFDQNVGSIDMDDYERLILDRNEDTPYVITLAEFMNNELEHEQDSVVYFQGDGILVDATDEVIEDPSAAVGDDNLVRFGHFSGDPKVVYVRNEVLKHDFEIVAHEGRYAFVVHGLEPESAAG